MADKYKKMKRQVSLDNGVTWNDVIPYEYIAGDLIEASSPDCSSVEWRVASGYICESTEEAVETRWVVVAGEYECVGYDKFTKEKEQVKVAGTDTWQDTGNTRAGATMIEADSTDCGYVPPVPTQTRWVTTTGYECVGYDKYNREKEEISVDGGEHWTDTGNTRAGSILIEADSTDCGYVPPTPTDYSTRYLTIVSETDNNWVYFMCDSSSVRKTISYSLDDGATWSTKAADVRRGTYFATLNTGDKMLLKGTNSTYGNSSFESNQLDCGNRFKLEGNVMSLIYGDNFIGQTTLTGTYAFSGLFLSDQLDNIDNLVMPATTLTEGCYRHMFYRCIFTSVPSNLLPATTLQSGCYSGMFTYCVNLTAAPELPATTLQSGCYSGMFENCTSLSYVKCLATSFNEWFDTDFWLENVSVTGTFVKASSATWSTDTSGIPSGWTVQNT